MAKKPNPSSNETKRASKLDLITENPFKVSAFVVIVLWVITPLFFLLIKFSRPYTLTQLGQIGDMYGFINSLFSGLTVAGLIYTIISQQKEITDTKKQLKIQSYQRFDNIFFNHLELHRNLLLALPNGGQSMKDDINMTDSVFRFDNDYDKILNKFRSIYENDFKIKYGQYILNYQNTINMIYARKQKEASRHRYVTTFLCQLNHYELTLIFMYYTMKNNQPPDNFNDYKSILYTLLMYVKPVDTNQAFTTVAAIRQCRIIDNLMV
jgi:hypothetical protein